VAVLADSLYFLPQEVVVSSLGVKVILLDMVVIVVILIITYMVVIIFLTLGEVLPPNLTSSRTKGSRVAGNPVPRTWPRAETAKVYSLHFKYLWLITVFFICGLREVVAMDDEFDYRQIYNELLHEG
jgi:hypothetical protein